MTKRKLGIALTVTVVAAAPAVVSAATTTRKPRIDLLGGASFVPNRYIQDKMRFNKDVYELRSGATIQIRSKTAGEAHTVSVVSKSDFPKTIAGFDVCFERGICATLSQAHGLGEDLDPPTTPLLNKGGAGFDTEGDSIAIGPPRPGTRDSVKLTARRGRTLHLLCLIHPWMQAKISVR